ncbi:MAG: pilus assembly protein TadG-related protein [Pseudomonas sp.]|nr:pilus assembly protein TadG-related protein [Pseudomonas sp.]
MSPRFHGKQRGAIGLMAAGVLAVVLAFTLLVIDSGRLYLEKRKLQGVADTAALEAVSRNGNCLAGLSAAAYAGQSVARNYFVVGNGNTLVTSCGSVTTGASGQRTFSANASKNDAVRVVATRSVMTSIASGIWTMFSGAPVATETILSATAVAAYAPPVAQLTIRSSLTTVDSTKSPLLNATIGGLLGGSLSLTAAGWNGLIQNNLNLLSYLDQLAIQLNVKAGDYDALLNTAVSASQLIDAAVKVLQKNGAVATAIVNDVISLKAIAPNTQLLTVGDLLKIATGTPTAALNTNVQLFQLLEAVAQVSSSKSAVSTAVQLNIPLIGNVSIQTKVIEPPQMAAIGNPAKAKAGLLKTPQTDQIYVRTAQVRTLVSIDLSVLKLVSGLASTVTSLATPVAGVVNNLLHLNLAGVVSSVLCAVACDSTDVEIASKLDILIEAAGAESRVIDFSCVSNTTKSLTVKAATTVATLAVGSIDATSMLSSSAPIAVQPIRLIDIGSRHCLLVALCGPRTPNVGGGLMLKDQSALGSQTGTLVYLPVAEMNLAPTYQTLQPAGDIVASLSGTLTGLQVTYVPPSGSVSSSALAGVAGLLTTYQPVGSNPLGALAASVVSLLGGVSAITTTLVGAIHSLLGPLLNPILNNLLNMLGISLTNVNVGANLTCGQTGEAYLVI